MPRDSLAFSKKGKPVSLYKFMCFPPGFLLLRVILFRFCYLLRSSAVRYVWRNECRNYCLVHGYTERARSPMILRRGSRFVACFVRRVFHQESATAHSSFVLIPLTKMIQYVPAAFIFFCCLPLLVAWKIAVSFFFPFIRRTWSRVCDVEVGARSDL